MILFCFVLFLFSFFPSPVLFNMKKQITTKLTINQNVLTDNQSSASSSLGGGEKKNQKDVPERSAKKKTKNDKSSGENQDESKIAPKQSSSASSSLGGEKRKIRKMYLREVQKRKQRMINHREKIKMNQKSPRNNLLRLPPHLVGRKEKSERCT